MDTNPEQHVVVRWERVVRLPIEAIWQAQEEGKTPVRWLIGARRMRQLRLEADMRLGVYSPAPLEQLCGVKIEPHSSPDAMVLEVA